MSEGKLTFLYRRQSGFTLLEVLVALSILAMSLGVLMQIFGDLSRAASISEDYRRAILVAESQLVQATADPSLRAVGTRGSADERFYWIVSAVQFEDASSGSRPQFNNIPSVVTVEVSWAEGERSRSISLNTIVLGVTARQRR